MLNTFIYSGSLGNISMSLDEYENTKPHEKSFKNTLQQTYNKSTILQNLAESWASVTNAQQDDSIHGPGG